jgi:hypothetical protein
LDDKLKLMRISPSHRSRLAWHRESLFSKDEIDDETIRPQRSLIG